jgi:hypothetical protein
VISKSQTRPNGSQIEIKELEDENISESSYPDVQLKSIVDSTVELVDKSSDCITPKSKIFKVSVSQKKSKSSKEIKLLSNVMTQGSLSILHIDNLKNSDEEFKGYLNKKPNHMLLPPASYVKIDRPVLSKNKDDVIKIMDYLDPIVTKYASYSIIITIVLINIKSTFQNQF